MYMECKSIFARSASSILGWLHEIPQLSSKSHTVLFTISPAQSWPGSSLSEVVTKLRSSSSSLGCLSAPIKLQMQKKSSQTAERNLEEYALCSVAIFDSRIATPFLSTIPGRETPQVGRWHALRKDVDAKLQDDQVPRSGVDWESIWAQKENQHDLPEELQHISANDVEAVLYCSDKAPEGLSNSLAHFAKASKLGILAHSTPFLTGRPHTLFYGRKILSLGAVGLCLHRSPRSPASLVMDFPDLQPVTPLLNITDIEGNLVHSIDNKNPSRLLLDAIAKLDSAAKDDTYYIGTYSSATYSPDATPDKLYNIMSGDPSRGTLALEGDSSPTEGARVQIFRRPAELRSGITPSRGLNLYTAYPDGLDVLLAQSTSSDGVVELGDAFLAVSENGLVVDRFSHETSRSSTAWRYTLPGGGCNVHWA